MKLDKKTIGIGSLIASAGLLWPAYEWLRSEFIPRVEYAPAYEALAATVENHDLELTYQAQLRHVEFLERQVDKYPNDIELKHKLEKAQQRLKELEKKRVNSAESDKG